MRKTVLLSVIMLIVIASASGQKLLIGEKAPEIRAKEWLPERAREQIKPKLIGFIHTANRETKAHLNKFEEIAQTYCGKIEVVVVTKESREEIEKIADQEREYYIVIDDNAKTFENFRVQFVPFSVLVDSKGRVVWFGNSMTIETKTMDKIVQ